MKYFEIWNIFESGLFGKWDSERNIFEDPSIQGCPKEFHGILNPTNLFKENLRNSDLPLKKPLGSLRCQMKDSNEFLRDPLGTYNLSNL